MPTQGERMVRAEPVNKVSTWRTKIARPVRTIQRVAFLTLVVACTLLMLGLGWLLIGLIGGTLHLVLWQQLLVVLGVVLLVSLAALAFRIAFFARIIHGFLR